MKCTEKVYLISSTHLNELHSRGVATPAGAEELVVLDIAGPVDDPGGVPRGTLAAVDLLQSGVGPGQGVVLDGVNVILLSV